MTEPLRYEEPMRRYRFLLSDGRVQDVESRRDDSRLREWVLTQLGVKKGDTVRIEGVALLTEQEPML